MLLFDHFANFNKTYGTLGAAIALMTWLYWTGFAMLVGAELNSELAKINHTMQMAAALFPQESRQDLRARLVPQYQESEQIHQAVRSIHRMLSNVS